MLTSTILTGLRRIHAVRYITLIFLSLLLGPTATLVHHRAPGPDPGLPLSFELNQGQADRESRYLSRGHGFTLFLSLRDATIHLAGDHDRQLQLEFIGADPAVEIEGMDEKPGRIHYLRGSAPGDWISDIPTFSGVEYRSLYPGIDLVFGGGRERPEINFVIASGADAGLIRIGHDGATHVDLDRDGNVIARIGPSSLVHGAPRAYQLVEDQEVGVEVRYFMAGPAEIGYELGEYEPDRPVHIQTQMGLSSVPVKHHRPLIGEGFRVAAGPDGGIYLTGRELTGDLFITRFDKDHSTVLYTAYLGGSGEEEVHDIAVDQSGSVVITGRTESGDFPTVGGLQPEIAGRSDAFVAKLSEDGSRLLQSSYLGGAGDDSGEGVAIGRSGAIWIALTTDGSELETTPDALQSAAGGRSDVFLVRLGPDGTELEYATYFGGEEDDHVRDVAIDRDGNVLLVGSTRSLVFPVAMPYQPELAGPGQKADAFVIKLSSEGSDLRFSTYLGGTGDDEASGIAVHETGIIHVAGSTSSPDFPLTRDPLQPALGGFRDAFVATLSPDGSSLLYSSFLGGSEDDAAAGVAVNRRGNIWMTGVTQSADFPGEPGRSPSPRGGADAFVVELSPDGTILLTSALIGGSQEDAAGGIALVRPREAVIAGETLSSRLIGGTGLEPSDIGLDAFMASAPGGGQQLACPGTITWDGDAADGLWQSATNWSTDVLPDPNDDVCIGAFDVTLSSGAQSINSLETGGSLEITAGSLEMAAASQIDGNLVFLGGTILGDGDLTVDGTTTWSAGDMTGTGSTIANGGLTISGSSTKDLFAGRTLVIPVGAMATWSGTGALRTGGSVIDNDGTFDVQTDADITLSFSPFTATIDNSGTFRKSAGALKTQVNNTFNNTGTLEVQSGTVELEDGGTGVSATYTGSGDGTIEFGSLTHNLDGTTVDVPNVVMSSGTLNLNSGTTLSGTTDITVTGGAVHANPGALVTSVGSGTVSGGILDFSGGVAVTLSSLDLSGSGLLTGSDAVSVTGATTWSAGDMTGTGSTTADGGLTISGSSAKDLFAGRTLVIPVGAMATWSGTGALRTGGSVIDNDGTFDVQTDADITLSFSPFTATIDNSGTFRKSAGAATTLVPGAFITTGTTEVPIGTLSFTGTYTQIAGVTRLTGGTLSASNPIQLQGGTLEGSGTVDASVNSTGGTVGPGLSAGILAIAESYDQALAATYSVEIGGLDPNVPDFDQIMLSGAQGATLSGTLDVSLIDAFNPILGDSFTIMTFPSRTGVFSTVNTPAVDPNWQYHIAYGTTDIVLSVEMLSTADLSLTMSDSPDPVLVGENVTYTLNLTNNGPMDATTVVVNDTLPPSASFVSATPTQGSCLESAGIVTCDLGEVLVSANASITIVVGTSTDGIITNMATVMANEFDPVPSTATDSEDTAVLPGCPEVDGDTYAPCGPGCLPLPGDTCGDCNDADPNISPAASEACDDIDNDCDGSTDEGLGSIPELCNQFDDNCNGLVDEGNPEGGGSCTALDPNGDPLLGACAVGTTICEPTGLECLQNVGPGPELCNGIDDDCDGVVDNESDNDSDGVSNCGDNCPDAFNPPSDCDADPNTPDEQCDGDSDGLGDICDCAPMDPANTPPGDVGTLDVTHSPGVTTIDWAPVPNVTQHNVYRGYLTEGNNFAYVHQCLSAGVTATDATDTLDPNPFSMFYYLVSSTCAGGTESALGQDSAGVDIAKPFSCPAITLDDDGDGTEEAVDNCPGFQNPTQADFDSDSHGDVCDNCAEIFNTGQSDLDMDGAGDACDTDQDGDGILEDFDGNPGTLDPCTGGATAMCDDNCPNIANPGQEDADSDGIGDVCDPS